MVASLGTYFCRALGIFSSQNIKANSKLFIWIKCVSIAMISAVIARIILFPAGILAETSQASRLISTIITLIVYFSFKKNIIFALLTSALCFIILNNYL